MSVETPPLSGEEKQQAHALWEALMLAPSRAHLERARQDLKAAVPNVKNAVIAANVRLWAESRDPQAGENPFS